MSQPDYIDLVLEAFDYIDRACCALAASCDPCEVHACPCRDCELVHCPGRGKGECPATTDVYGDPLPELDVGDLFDEGDEEGFALA